MRKIILAITLLCFTALNASSQEIYKEVKRIMRNAETIKNDTTKNLEDRKIATFKSDAIYYLMMKAAEADNFSEYELGNQANAMIEFVNIFVKRMSKAKKKEDKDIIITRFKNATTRNPLFNDPEKEIVYAYVDNDRYVTQFSIDTNWIKAIQVIKN